MSNLIYKIVRAALADDDLTLLEYELAQRIKNDEVASAIINGIAQAIRDHNSEREERESDDDFTDYTGE